MNRRIDGQDDQGAVAPAAWLADDLAGLGITDGHDVRLDDHDKAQLGQCRYVTANLADGLAGLPGDSSKADP